MDDVAGFSVAEFEAAMDRAVERSETVEFYGHKPGVTVPVDKLEAIVAAADERGLPFVLYSDFAHGEGNGPGVALSLDDNSVSLWDDIRPMLRQYNAHLTFFVSRYTRLSDDQKATLKDFLNDGHELQPHSINHLREPEYVEDRGLAALMNEEVLPSIDALRADGYPAEAFAYPFGARTSEIDEEILKHVGVLRSLSFPYGFPVEDACP
ncbi:MAG TPA: polysaccharide deacetylase family protein [Kofleriaceae bacterium]